MWEELFYLSALSCGTFFFSGFIFFFTAKFICLVIQLLSVSHILLLLLAPDHLFICHQVHHVLLAEHLQLLDSFSSKNAGCYHHWYNRSELWLWTVIRWGFFPCDRDYKGNKKCGPVVFWKDRRVFSKAQPSIEQAEYARDFKFCCHERRSCPYKWDRKEFDLASWLVFGCAIKVNRRVT